MAMTIEQIASNLAISVTTVKLVHNGKADKYRISKKTQARVNDFIQEHGIIVNQTARSLKLKKSNTLGLIVPSITNVFFSSLIEHLEKQASSLGYQIITICSDEDENKGEKAACNLIERGVDGIFMVPNSQQQQLNIVNKFPKKPFIFLDQDFQISEHNIVISDNKNAFYEMTKKIWDKRINETFVICGDPQLPSIRSRLEGFIDACQDLKRSLPSNWLYAVSHNTFNCGYEGMKSLMNDTHRIPESIIFSSLPILEGALHFLKNHNGAIPTTMIIGTFDEHTMLEFLPNPIISVQQNAAEIALNSSSLMNKMLNQEAVPSRLVVAANIISRG